MLGGGQGEGLTALNIFSCLIGSFDLPCAQIYRQCLARQRTSACDTLREASSHNACTFWLPVSRLLSKVFMVVVVRAPGEHFRFDSDPEAYLH